MNYWLIKSEDTTYSIDDMKRDGVIDWFGIRNYQARNYMRDSMNVGDLVLFYHSNAKPSGVHGVVRVASLPHTDHTALNPTHHYFDPKATPEKPIWVCVDFVFVEKLSRSISPGEMQLDPTLSGMQVTQKGQRLSIQPVSETHFKHILTLGS